MAEDLGLSLEIPAETAFACPVAGLANVLAERAGFGQREKYRFQLTVEEFCLYLAGLAANNRPLTIGLTGKRHQLRASFAFQAANLSLGALNITSRATTGTLDASAEEMGLLLAGKAADRFHLKHKGADRFLLEAEVDRAYPETAPVHLPEGLRPPYTIRRGSDSAQLTQAAALASAVYPPWQCPSSFRTPGKFPDMVADCQATCVLACDAKGQTAGLLAWSPCSEQGLYFSGPFVFAPREEAANVARLLIDGFLETVARESYSIVLSFRATVRSPRGLFRDLGDPAIFCGRPIGTPSVVVIAICARITAWRSGARRNWRVFCAGRMIGWPCPGTFCPWTPRPAGPGGNRCSAPSMTGCAISPSWSPFWTARI